MTQDAEMRRLANQRDCARIEGILKEQNLTHLKAQGRGDHLVIYSLDQGEKVSRVRLSRLAASRYQLGFADHRGRWESTPFTGTIDELLHLLTDQFPWVLAPY